MSPSTLFIRRPVATTLLTFGVAAAGVPCLEATQASNSACGTVHTSVDVSAAGNL